MAYVIRNTDTLFVNAQDSQSVAIESYDDSILQVDSNVYLNPTYTGSYTVIPSQHAHELQTAGFAMKSNVTIEAIPNCYGLIEWNGAYIKVS